MADFDRAEKNLYFPTTWKTMDAADSDLGASNPIYLSIPGSVPANYLMAIAKDGHLYLLNSSNLGGMGGQVLDLKVANGAGAVRTSPASYRTAKGTHIVFSTSSGATCPPGSATGQAMVSVLITAGSPPSAAVDWCAPLEGQVTAPIATTTDGSNDAVVWYISDGQLMAVDGDTGESLYQSAESCDDVHKWTSPIAVKGRIVVGASDHMCSWSTH